MQATKVKRGYWKIEGGCNYATLERTSQYDASKRWVPGWHINIRDGQSGKILYNGFAQATRQLAEIEAIKMLLPTEQCGKVWNDTWTS